MAPRPCSPPSTCSTEPSSAATCSGTVIRSSSAFLTPSTPRFRPESRPSHPRQLRSAQASEGARLARPARALRLPLHADIVLLAQCRGRLLCQAVQATFEAWRLPIRRRSPGSHQSIPRRNKPGAKALHMDRGPGQNHRRRQTRAPNVRFHPLVRRPILPSERPPVIFTHRNEIVRRIGNLIVR